MKYVPVPLHAETDFTGCTLVLVCREMTLNDLHSKPSLTTGNVGQLALDVLVPTFSLNKVGFLSSPFIVPLIGNDALGELNQGALVTSLEVFYSASARTVVVQQRAPVIKGKQKKFVEDLIAWYKASAFQNIVLLSSIDKATRTDDALLVGSHLRYIKNSAFNVSLLQDKCHWTALEEDFQEPFKKGTSSYQLLAEAEKESIPLLCLILFVSEGDNRGDGVQMAHHVNEFLRFSENGNWVIPKCWEKIFNTSPYDKILFM